MIASIRGRVRILAVGLPLLAAPHALYAALETYTDRSAWEAAVVAMNQSVVTESFDAGYQHGDSFAAPGQLQSTLGFSFTNTSGATSNSGAAVPDVNQVMDPAVEPAAGSPNGSLFLRADNVGPDDPSGATVFSFDQPVVAFGLDYTHWGGEGDGLIAGDGTELFLPIPAALGVSQFIGFIHDGRSYSAISTVSRTHPDNGYHLDNVSFSVVPAPGTGVVCVFAVMTGVLRRVRREHAQVIRD